ncbi:MULTISPECIES: paeninodin family lasso peptide [Priestia]|nr:paeninodin family lasso peptide [Priestia aryabhattai]MBY0214413.1 paeninodin family lasso peptide [Priestia aryabhattai]MDT0148419.1 paeninodin family lasso peptide [Priestia aryabhattai]MDT0153715.1 paeninodin family lasso peptide [Priestia aryabhattai]
MKKEWKKPELEVLDVNKTMLGTSGDYTDAAFPAHTPKGDITLGS